MNAKQIRSLESMLKKYRTAVHLYGAEQDAITVDVHNVIADAKEEQGKVLTMQDVMLACGELNKRERVAVQWVLDRCRPSKGGKQHSPTWLGNCSGCTDPRSEGTHQMGTFEHPDIAPAKGSGLTVDEVMEALDNVGRHEGWGIVTVAKGALRKALEAHAEKADGTK